MCCRKRLFRSSGGQALPYTFPRKVRGRQSAWALPTEDPVICYLNIPETYLKLLSIISFDARISARISGREPSFTASLFRPDARSPSPAHSSHIAKWFRPAPAGRCPGQNKLPRTAEALQASVFNMQSAVCTRLISISRLEAELPFYFLNVNIMFKPFQL